MTRKPRTMFGAVWWDYGWKDGQATLGIEAERGKLDDHFICYLPHPAGKRSNDAEIAVAEAIIKGLRAAGLADEEGA